MTNTPPKNLPGGIRLNEEADNASAAWAEYRRTRGFEPLYKAGIWARPEPGDEDQDRP